MRDQYSTSPLFSAETINELNDAVARFDGRLVLFAYYDPKPYLPGTENLYFNFYRAVINLGALFSDCNVAFRAISSDIEKYKNFRYTLTTMRTLFCHNYPDENNSNILNFNYNVSKNWLSKITVETDQDTRDMQDIWTITRREKFISLENNKWRVLLEKLETKVSEIIKEIREYLEKQDNQNNKFVEKIIDQMAESYNKNKDAQTALVAEYLQAKDALQSSKRPKFKNWNDVKYYVKDQTDFTVFQGQYQCLTDDELANLYMKMVWFNKAAILDVLNDDISPRPALPFDVLKLQWDILAEDGVKTVIG